MNKKSNINFGSKKKQKFNAKKIAIVAVASVIILGLGTKGIKATTAFISEQNEKRIEMKRKAEEEKILAEKKRKEEEEKAKMMIGVGPNGKEYADDASKVAQKLNKYDYSNNGKKVVYLTFDDGTSTTNTPSVLKTLKENDVKATFFMIERNMINFKEEVKNVRDQGHSVGFHSVTHDIKQLYKTPEATLSEFDTCNNTYYDITGYESKLIRLPYGSKPYMPQESHDKLIENGYIMWDWNLDTQDWRATTDNIVSNVLYYARDKQHLVLLMHEKEQTVNALDPMIKVLKQRGYTIMPITEKIEPRNFWEKNL